MTALTAQVADALRTASAATGHTLTPADADHLTQALTTQGLLPTVEVISSHWCTPGCSDGCRVAKTRYLRTETEVIEERPQLTDGDLTSIRDRIAALPLTGTGPR